MIRFEDRQFEWQILSPEFRDHDATTDVIETLRRLLLDQSFTGTDEEGKYTR